MGLIRAIGAAISTVAADQWKEFFTCDALSNDTLVANGSIRAEHGAGQSDNGVQIKLTNELFLDIHFRIVQTEQETIRHDNGGSAVFLQTVQDNRHKQIGCL